jgi:hypothetical protein
VTAGITLLVAATSTARSAATMAASRSPSPYRIWASDTYACTSIWNCVPYAPFQIAIARSM